MKVFGTGPGPETEMDTGTDAEPGDGSHGAKQPEVPKPPGDTAAKKSGERESAAEFVQRYE